MFLLERGRLNPSLVGQMSAYLHRRPQAEVHVQGVLPQGVAFPQGMIGKAILVGEEDRPAADPQEGLGNMGECWRRVRDRIRPDPDEALEGGDGRGRLPCRSVAMEDERRRRASCARARGGAESPRGQHFRLDRRRVVVLAGRGVAAHGCGHQRRAQGGNASR